MPSTPKCYTSLGCVIECINPIWRSAIITFDRVKKEGNLQLLSSGTYVSCISSFDLELNSMMLATMLNQVLLHGHGRSYWPYQIHYQVCDQCIAHVNWICQIVVEVCWYSDCQYGTIMFQCRIGCQRKRHLPQKGYTWPASSNVPILIGALPATASAWFAP